ncbi:substrate-binding domain-containing protein [Proteus mirabilis]|uniref:substrate-binding domain-containing protein n=1 Tax=Proteus mirabilis TaxID=584 RepID=UPI0020903B98|nr:substrate-binding domain-containing protein [Proteus mirabilis]
MRNYYRNYSISLSPDSPDTDNQAQVIQVGSVETAISLIQHGLGYARLPLIFIQDELNKKTIKQLITHKKEKEYKFYLYLNKNSFINENLQSLLSTISYSTNI